MMADAPALDTEDIGTVEDRFFTLRDFRLSNGAVMPEATIAYEAYGQLAASAPMRGRNAVPPTPISWMRSSRSTPPPGLRPTPTSSWPRLPPGSPAIRTGTAAIITAAAN